MSLIFKTMTFADKKIFLERMIEIANKWDWSKPLVIKLDELRRKEIQSRKFHAICTDFSKQLPWAGSMRTAKQWKHLLISGHAIATQLESEIVEGLEGELLNIRESSSSMTIRRMASLIEYSIAYGTSNQVKFNEKVDAWYDSLPEAQR